MSKTTSNRLLIYCFYNKEGFVDDYVTNFLESFRPYCKDICVVIKKYVIEKVGLFDEAYAPAFLEDNGLSFRAMYVGYNLVYTNSVFIFHNHSTSSNAISSNILNVIKNIFLRNIL